MFNLVGRQEKLDPVFGSFKNCKMELRIDQGCLIWGKRAIIPKTIQ